ncbi:inactive receptor kinase [Pyrus ussuriensis x Pyrus communis]|uniref:Inactive receptor kinase n=1 Tax=Pyrus ussuriensis x Pyrus communis TaxID=2448454 RepID=A0A5N5F5U6_9ROSA|nr:inactive receptor kinase [Pyrus ussuriensis x Pyrus communis]
MKLQVSFCTLIFLFLVPPFPSSVFSDLNSDRQVLLNFAATVVHIKKLNWNASTPVCTSWVGITCSLNKTSVTAIHLPAIGLFGSIPSNSIGKLHALQVLSLRSNFLYGSLPSDILSIPSLEYLYLQHNNFSGVLPASLPPNLVVLDFSFNSFSGSIPTKIQNLTRLTTLYLQNNFISGAIPNLNLPALKLLNLSYNNLNGSVPYSLEKYSNSSFVGNPQLCGEPLNNCSKTTSSTPSAYPAFLPPSPTILKNHHATLIKKLSPGSIIAMAFGCSAVFILLVLVVGICCWKRTNKVGGGMLKGKAAGDGKGEMPKDFGSGVQEAEKNKLFFFEGCYYNFDLEDLLRASAEVLGKGSFGTTYKAVLDEETTVVVKRLREVVVGKREFEQHMELVEKVGKHPNVLPPHAYYFSKDEKLLVYNYIPTGSLFAHLHGSSDAGRSPLDWDSRVKISLGIAKGLAHIHSEGAKSSHGNIKSTNVLLTQELEACISDVGLSPLMNFPPTMSRAMGYRAPEAIDMRKITHKSDVYSFGVLLLEMLTGKITLQYPSYDCVVDLPRWVKSVVREEWTAEVFDLELVKQQHSEEEMVQMLQIALACVTKLPETRPNMEEVVRMIEELRQSDTKTRQSSESEFNVQTP